VARGRPRGIGTYSPSMPAWEFPAPSVDDPRVRIRELGAETDPPVANQHVVSRVVLKGFAAPGSRGHGWELTPFDIRHRREMKRRGLKECGKVTNFVPYASGSAERLWKPTEDRLGAAITAARDRRLHDCPDHVETIKDCLALHLVRSHRYLAVHRDSVANVVREVRRNVPFERAAALEDEFFRRHGLHAAGPNALRTIVDGVVDEWLRLDDTGAIVRTTIEEMFPRVRAALRRQPIEVWHVPTGRELLISDSPAVTVQYLDSGNDCRLNVALGDAHAAVLPLATDCAVAIGPADKDDVLLPGQVDYCNKIQILAAHRYVYYRPGSGLGAFVESVLSRDS
jgi:uncharacterized protein DUF4238